MKRAHVALLWSVCAVVLALTGAAPVHADNEQVSIAVSGLAVYTFTGYAAPYSMVTFMENGAAVGTTVTDQNGYFVKQIGETDTQIHTISYYFTDPAGNQSTTLTTSTSTTINNNINVPEILFPPTLTVSTNVLNTRDILTVSGYTVPNALVTLWVDGSPYSNKAIAVRNGMWNVNISGAVLGLGLHTVYATVSHGGPDSEPSTSGTVFVTTAPPIPSPPQAVSSQKTITTLILPQTSTFLPEDFNRDHIVNETDLGMLLAHFETPPVGDNSKYDLNHDGKIDAVDFSIFLYYWGWRD